MRAVIVVCAGLLVVAVALVLRRVEVGPTVLDRVIALDVLVSTLLAGFVLYSAWSGRTDFLGVMVVLALVGFVGAVTLARFVAAESEEEARILTPDEVTALEERESAVIDALDSGAASALGGDVGEGHVLDDDPLERQAPRREARGDARGDARDEPVPGHEEGRSP